jgi:hypothetical protein
MGIRITGGKLKEGCKLGSKIASYLFEQEYGELQQLTESERTIIRKAASILCK